MCRNAVIVFYRTSLNLNLSIHFFHEDVGNCQRPARRQLKGILALYFLGEPEAKVGSQLQILFWLI